MLAAMDEFGVDRRREPVIAIGGGVLCHIVGFAASIYRRGTPLHTHTHHLGRPDRCGRRGEDRGQPPLWQEPHRHLRPAAAEPSRHQLPRHPPAAAPQ
ncbi:hypothetical protein [Streptomyces sp. NPDC051129]|uniref:hypothetical protein n=1 Tax=Streptomyces sp. NPDC051129 TaxID=3154639 RepID=UPI00342030E9